MEAKDTKIIIGLTIEEVEERKRKNLVNYDTSVPTKSIKRILLENFFTLFNFLNLFLAVAIFLVGSYKNMLFLGIVIINTAISTFQEIHSKRIVDKLSVMASSKARVIRNGKKQEISINDLVLDDVVEFNTGNQVATDSKILQGEVQVNESFLTGEPDTILKSPANEFVENFIGKRRIWNNPEVLKANDIMIEEPTRVNMKRTVLQGIEIMRTNHVDSLMVTDKIGTLLGLVTLKSLKLKDRDVSIESVMEPHLITVNENENLISVLTLMNENNVGYIPVIDKKDLLKGLITRSSILSALSDQLLDMEVNF